MLEIIRSSAVNDNGLAAINGRGLQRRKLTLDQRIELAADLACGQQHLHPSIRHVAALLKVLPLQVRARLKARAQQEVEWLQAERRRQVQNEAEAANIAADRIVSEWRRSSPEAREAAFRTIGASEIWDILARVVA